MARVRRKISDEEKAWVVDKFRDRLPQFAEEIIWAVGGRLPKGMKRPPKWLKRCISRIVFGNARPPKVTNEHLKKFLPYINGAFDGLTTTTQAALTNLTDEGRQLEKIKPEIRELRLATKAGIKKMLKEKKIPPARSLRPANFTAEEWKAYFEGAQDGSLAAIEADKKISISDDILWFMWIFRSETEGVSSRSELHAWISDEMRFVECDFKIFEKVCRQIKYRSLGNKRRMRGNFRSKSRPTA
jgi:hypothetical protein